MADTVTVVIPGMAECALDISNLRNETIEYYGGPLDMEWIKSGHGYRVQLTMSMEIAKKYVSWFYERTESGGYDDPPSWNAACRVARKRLIAAIAESERAS